MPSDFSLLRQVRSAIGQALDRRASLLEAAAAKSAEIASLDAAASKAAAAGDAAATRDSWARADAARQDRSQLVQQLAAVDAGVREQLGRLVDRVDPCDAEADVPLALFPVRLETRFGDQGATLRIRVFPDDIHVDQLDRGLSDDEQAAGRAYWTAVWSADDAAAGAAWIDLTTRVHADRAAWVAAALTPINLASAGPAAVPQFPAVGLRTRRAAVARLLPDRFVAIATQKGVASAPAVGAPIPPELVVGLLADDGSTLAVTASGAKVLAGAEWLVDYDQALANGLAITMPLAYPNQPVEQLLVFGVRSSLDPDRARLALEDQLRGHRYTRGLAVVRQGTPSNNTESDRADWQSTRTLPGPGRVPPAAPAPGTNGAAVAAALGVDPVVLSGIDSGDGREQPLALAANVALWAPSWGGLLDRVTTITKDGKTLSDEAREQVRTFFRDFVRGRGPVPAIRVGNQPYGILPVSSLDKHWRASRGVPLEAGLSDFLRTLRIKWRQSLDAVPQVGGPGAPIDATLLDILGTSPVMQGLRVRTVLADGLAEFASSATGGPADAQQLEQMIERIVLEDLVLFVNFEHPVGSLEKKSRPLSLPLVDASDPAFIDGLLAGTPPPEASVFQALLRLSWSAAQTAVNQAAPADTVGSLVGRADALPSDVRERVRSLVFRAGRASAAEMHAGADRVASLVGESGAAVLAERAPIAALRTSLGALALASTSAAASAELVPLALGGWLRAQARLAELRAALLELRAIPGGADGLEARRILVAETLDLASHRLDAWLTGLVERRRASLRASRPRGIVIGAYGWVENLVPGGGAANDGGYVHAPSIAHAVTAGLLRSAYLTHNHDASGSGAFAVDLSSARVRLALDLLEGMRQGQPLGALLGYRIERAMHEAGLDRLVLSLRAVAPLVDGHLTSRGETVTPEAAEAVAATNVVDGARLIELYRSDPGKIFSALVAPPLNNPYIVPGQWPPFTKADQDAVAAAIESAIAASDAVADLLLAEAVHQLAQGNTARAAGALDAAGSGAAPPVEPTVVQTPAPGVPFTHRLMLVVDGTGAGWSTTRPRAKAEPRLEQWAGARLGPPSVVVVHVAADGTRTTLDAAGLAALDLVYESGSPARLEDAIRAAIPAIPAGDPLVTGRDPAWPADLRSLREVTGLAVSLRAVLVSARPSMAGDWTRPTDQPARAVDAADLAALEARAADARGGLAASLAALDAALSPPGSAAVDSAALAAALEGVGAYGVATARVAGDSLVPIGQLAAGEAKRRIDAADNVLGGTFDAQAATKVSQALFGDGFWMLPAIAPPPAPDLLSGALAAGGVNPPGGAIRRFLRDTASVRAAVARHAEALLLGDAIDRRASLRVAQLVAVGTVGAARWIGGPLDPAEPTPDQPVTDLVLEAPAGYDGMAAAAALVIDEWVDVVPRRVRRGDGDGVVDGQLVSGLAVNAAGPGARAPQAILLAISPDGARWTTAALADVLADALDLAKIRAVTLERTNGVARLLPALYEQSWSLQGEPVLDLHLVSEHPVMSAVVPYIRESAT